MDSGSGFSISYVDQSNLLHLEEQAIWQMAEEIRLDCPPHINALIDKNNQKIQFSLVLGDLLII